MTSQGGGETFTMKRSNPHRQRSFSSAAHLEMHLRAKMARRRTHINCWDDQRRVWRHHQGKLGGKRFVIRRVISLI